MFYALWLKKLDWFQIQWDGRLYQVTYLPQSQAMLGKFWSEQRMDTCISRYWDWEITKGKKLSFCCVSVSSSFLFMAFSWLRLRFLGSTMLRKVLLAHELITTSVVCTCYELTPFENWCSADVGIGDESFCNVRSVGTYMHHVQCRHHHIYKL